MMEEVKTPLSVFVCWHKNYQEGKEYAERIFNELTRNKDDYVGESLGIPVYFVNNPTFNHIDELKKSQYNVIILLFNSDMALDKDWDELISKLCEAVDINANYKLYPIAVENGIESSCPNINLKKKNFIRLENNNSRRKTDPYFEDKCCNLLFEVVHGVDRLLFNRSESVKGKYDSSEAALKIFISYATKDGSKYAEMFNRYINENTSLERFVDINSINAGEDFQKIIETNLSNCALLILCTDNYSARQWCQHEALYAKYKGCPIILVDAIQTGEARRFPYLANVKTVHLGHNKNVSNETKRKVIYSLLRETLKVKYGRLYLKYLEQINNAQKEHMAVFSYPPELFTLLFNEEQTNSLKTFLYLEPPLNKNEIKILKKLNPEWEFITPTYLMGYKDKISRTDVNGRKIGVSISELSEEGDGVKTNLHLSQLYIELCRYLLARNYVIVYGGQLNYSGKFNFIDILKNLISAYYPDGGGNVAVEFYNLHNLSPISGQEELALLKHKIRVNKVASPLTTDAESRDFQKEAYCQLRRTINNACDARIILGGKTTNYTGALPGLIEETYLAMKTNKPVYIIGGYGGSAEWIVSCLDGHVPKNIDNEEVADYFKKSAYNNFHNGLTKEENRKLCHSDNMSELIALILSGLARLGEQNK